MCAINLHDNNSLSVCAYVYVCERERMSKNTHTHTLTPCLTILLSFLFYIHLLFYSLLNTATLVSNSIDFIYLFEGEKEEEENKII